MYFRYDHPVKRFKSESKEHQKILYTKGIDLYAMFNHNGVTNTTNNELVNNIKTQPPFIKQEIQENFCQVSIRAFK